MTYLLGIDVGTSSVKAVLLRSDDTSVLFSAEHEYPLLKPQPDHAEQNPYDWWEATIQSVRQVLATSAIDRGDIRGIGLSGQMHGMVCLNAEGKPLRPAIIWADKRSRSQCISLERDIGLPNLASFAPGLPASGFMGPTLMWLHQHEPDTIALTKIILLPKDYVRYRLTGHLGTDFSDASATWLFDIETNEWSEYLIKLCGIDERYLPPLSECKDIVGALTPESATKLGLPLDIPVVAGCADQPAQSLGNGLIDGDRLLLTIGTGGQIFHLQNTPKRDPQSRYYVFNHAIPAHWYALPTILTGGLALRWLRDLIGLQNSPHAYETMSNMANDVSAGADGLLFIPHLAGERLSHIALPSDGAFLGLKLHHRPAHLVRAVMEGVIFAMKEQLILLEAEDVQMTISGGVTKSQLWRQIQADVYDRILLVNDSNANHAAIGAALIAGIGCGIYQSFADACSRLPKLMQFVEPNPAHVSIYRDCFAHYVSLYQGIKMLKS